MIAPCWTEVPGVRRFEAVLEWESEDGRLRNARQTGVERQRGSGCELMVCK